MHDLNPACNAWKEKERKNSQCIVQSFGTEVVRVCKCVFLQRLLQKCNSAGQACTRALHSLCPSTLDSVLIIGILENIFTTASEKISSFCTQHVSKKKTKTIQNVKLEIQDLWKQKKKRKKNPWPWGSPRDEQESSCALVLINTPSPLRHGTLFSTCFRSTGHQFIDATSIFASPFPHTRAAASPVSVYKQSGCRYRTPQLFWLPLPMQSVRSPCWSQQTKVSGLHSSSSLAFCPRVQVV